MQASNIDDIEKLFRKQYEELCALSFSYIGNMEKVEDIVQDVFITILLKDSEYIFNLEAYIKTAVKNASLNSLRRTKKTAPLDENLFTIPSSENSGLQDNEIHEKLKLAIENLPTQCRKVFELCAVNGEKYSSAAASLNISVNTVKSHIKKAYKTLRIELQNVYLSLLFFVILMIN